MINPRDRRVRTEVHRRSHDDWAQVYEDLMKARLRVAKYRSWTHREAARALYGGYMSIGSRRTRAIQALISHAAYTTNRDVRRTEDSGSKTT